MFRGEAPGEQQNRKGRYRDAQALEERCHTDDRKPRSQQASRHDATLHREAGERANPDNTQLIGPTTIAVAPFTRASGTVPRLGAAQELETLGDRVMFRLAYRNFGDHESLVLNHSVSANGTIGIRWYELQDPNGNPFVKQQGTYVPDDTFRWMGSIAMDKAGDIAVGYSAWSSAINPAIRYTGRTPADPLGILAAENSIVEGTGSQRTSSTRNRWGDYSALTVDPTDDCTFWFTTEYRQADGTSNWNTRIASFSFPSCGAGPQDAGSR